MLGVVFIALAVLTATLVTYLMGVIPESYIYVANGTISVGSSLPNGATGVSNKLIINIIGWGVTVVLFISGIYRLKVRI